MPRQGLGHSSVDIYNMVTPGTDDPVWKHPVSGQLMVGYQETRTNNVLHSQDATDAEAWTKTNTAIDSTLYEAPDNSTTANAIKSDSTGTKVYRILQGNLSVTTGKTYTLSVHVKKGTLGFARVQFNDSSVNYSADFNLNTAAVTNTSNTITTQVDSMDDDWYRCSITFQVQNTTSSGVAYVFAQSAAGTSTSNIAVSGIVLIYVWGFQLEENSEMSTYIPTTSSARTVTTPLNDTSEIWDFDGADLMPEEKPSDDGAWEVPDNLVLNHDYADLGSELVPSIVSIENAGGGTITQISGNSYSSISDSTSGSGIRPKFDFATTSGKTYKLVITPTGTITGTVNFDFYDGSSYLFQNYDFTTTKEIYFTDNGSVFGAFDGTQTYNITGFTISVKQVDPNDRWTLGTNVSISDGKLNWANSPNNNGGTQSSSFTQGTAYEITFTVSDYSSGSVRIRFPFVGIRRTANGTYTQIGVADQSTSDIFIQGEESGGNTATLSVDNVTIREYAVQPKDV